MNASLTDLLCTRCGLCCDGTLFADVELAGRGEVSRLESLGLDVEDPDGDHRGLLSLPCRALHGTRCSIYAHRPKCCRTFECRLLQEAQRGLVDVEQAGATITDALGRVARIRALLAAVDPDDDALSLKERCVDALGAFDETRATPRSARARDKLEAEMDGLEQVIREKFLDGPR